MKEIVFIINPFSGTSKKKNFQKTVEEKLDLSKYRPSFKYTEYPGHGTEISREAVEQKKDIVVAVGGDGTINEIARPLIHSHTTLAIIPAGSGNGFSRHLNIPMNVGRAIEIINAEEVWNIDTCTVNGTFYINVAGLGFDAKIAYLTKNNNQRGFFPYFQATMQESFSYDLADLVIKADDQVVTGRYIAAIVANASRYGYQFTVAPKAKITDGIVDVILIKEAPVYRYFISAYRFLNKTIHKSRLVDTIQAREVSIKSKRPTYMHIDGEVQEPGTEFNFQIQPASLRVIARTV